MKANPAFLRNDKSPIASKTLPVKLSRSTALGTEYIVGKYDNVLYLNAKSDLDNNGGKVITTK